MSRRAGSCGTAPAARVRRGSRRSRSRGAHRRPRRRGARRRSSAAWARRRHRLLRCCHRCREAWPQPTRSSGQEAPASSPAAESDAAVSANGPEPGEPASAGSAGGTLKEASTPSKGGLGTWGGLGRWRRMRGFVGAGWPTQAKCDPERHECLRLRCAAKRRDMGDPVRTELLAGMPARDGAGYPDALGMSGLQRPRPLPSSRRSSRRASQV
jgi:hypothetical protein